MPDLLTLALTLDLAPAVSRLPALLAACAGLVPPGHACAVGHGLCVLRARVRGAAPVTRWHVADLEGDTCVLEATVGPYGYAVQHDQPGAWEGRLLAWAEETRRCD